MKIFLSVHQNDIIDHLTFFDRMIFRGHLTGFYPAGAFARLRLLRDPPPGGSP